MAEVLTPGYMVPPRLSSWGRLSESYVVLIMGRPQTNNWASVAGWPHAVTSYSIMQEPERKLSEPSVWEHPPDWQGVPSTLCKCTLSRTHSPSTIFQYPQCSWEIFKTTESTEVTVHHCRHNEGRMVLINALVSHVWCFHIMLVWILEGSPLSLHHCKCTLCSN